MEQCRPGLHSIARWKSQDQSRGRAAEAARELKEAPSIERADAGNWKDLTTCIRVICGRFPIAARFDCVADLGGLRALGASQMPLQSYLQCLKWVEIAFPYGAVTSNGELGTWLPLEGRSGSVR